MCIRHPRHGALLGYGSAPSSDYSLHPHHPFPHDGHYGSW